MAAPFLKTAEEVEVMRPHYNPGAIIHDDEELGRVMQLLRSGHFSMFEPGIFEPIINAITNPHDPWMVAVDFRSFVAAQRRVADAYRDRERWTRMSIVNTACSGRFSTDRTIQEYNNDIWHLQSVPAQKLE